MWIAALSKHELCANHDVLSLTIDPKQSILWRALAPVRSVLLNFRDWSCESLQEWSCWPCEGDSNPSCMFISLLPKSLKISYKWRENLGTPSGQAKIAQIGCYSKGYFNIPKLNSLLISSTIGCIQDNFFMVKCEILEPIFNIGLVLTRQWERHQIYKVGASHIHVKELVIILLTHLSSQK